MSVLLDLDTLIAGLKEASNRTLGWVELQPPIPQDDELSPPTEDHDPPYVMPAPVLVNSSNYRFGYETVRYARFNYLLERNGLYEAGEISVLHDLVISQTFTIPNIDTGRLVRFCPDTPTCPITGNLGVELVFIHDTGTTTGVGETGLSLGGGSKPRFGLGFRITEALPAVYPKLTMSYITAFAPEDD